MVTRPPQPIAHRSVDVETVDYHTAGEPFRIVAHGVPTLAGTTVAERRMAAISDAETQRLRRTLCHEPRGHADMYGGFIVPPDDDGADFGVLFWHKDGYSTACGHGTIALGVWAVHSGAVVADPDGVTTVRIDVPSGRVTAQVTCVAGVVTGVVFENVASFAIARSVELITSRGPVSVGLSYSGAIYASLAARDVRLEVTPEHYVDLIAIGREIKWALNDSPLARHPTDERLSGVYGTIIFDDLGVDVGSPATTRHQRNITVFADGEVDRSPCGSGTGARLALLAEYEGFQPDHTLVHDSIIGSRFLGRIRAAESPGSRYPEVQGMAYRTGEHRFTLDEADPLGEGFVLR